MNNSRILVNVPAGWVDLQVNGFVGVDFSAPGLRVEDVRRATNALVQRGTGPVAAAQRGPVRPLDETGKGAHCDVDGSAGTGGG